MGIVFCTEACLRTALASSVASGSWSTKRCPSVGDKEAGNDGDDARSNLQARECQVSREGTYGILDG